MSSNLNTKLNTNSNDEVYELVDESGNIVEYDMSRLHFTETKQEKIPNEDPNAKPLYYYRILIKDKRPDGTLQDFLIKTPEYFTYGISESKDTKGVLNGYSLPFPIWNKEGATPEQTYLTNLLEDKILTAIKEHLVKSGESFKQPRLNMSNLENMTIFFRKKDDKGYFDESVSPTWYPKLLVSKKKNMKIITRFFLMDEDCNSYVDQEGNGVEIDPSQIIGKWGFIRPVIKLEGIYIGSGKFSVQMKVWESDYRPSESTLPRKSKLNLATSKVFNSTDNNPLSVLMMAHKSQNASQEVVKAPEPEPVEEKEFEAPPEPESQPIKVARKVVLKPTV